MDGVRTRDQIIQGVRDLRAHYELRINLPDGSDAVLLRVARHTQAAEAAATWPGTTPIQIVRVPGIHWSTVLFLGVLIPNVVLVVIMAVTANIWGLVFMHVFGPLSALLLVGKPITVFDWLDATRGLRLSAEDTVRLRACTEATTAAILRQR